MMLLLIYKLERGTKMTFTRKFRNFFTIFMLYALDILHPEIKPERMITAREFKYLK